MSKKRKNRITITLSEAENMLMRCPHCGRKAIMSKDESLLSWGLSWYLPRCSDNHCFDAHKQPVMPSTGMCFTDNIREAVRYWNVRALEIRLVNFLQKQLQNKIGTC